MIADAPKRPRVLVVDDNAELVENLTEILEGGSRVVRRFVVLSP